MEGAKTWLGTPWFGTKMWLLGMPAFFGLQCAKQYLQWINCFLKESLAKIFVTCAANKRNHMTLLFLVCICKPTSIGVLLCFHSLAFHATNGEHKCLSPKWKWTFTALIYYTWRERSERRIGKIAQTLVCIVRRVISCTTRARVLMCLSCWGYRYMHPFTNFVHLSIFLLFPVILSSFEFCIGFYPSSFLPLQRRREIQTQVIPLRPQDRWRTYPSFSL